MIVHKNMSKLPVEACKINVGAKASLKEKRNIYLRQKELFVLKLQLKIFFLEFLLHYIRKGVAL